MSNETNALQANFKTATGALFNVYGKTPQEFYANLQAFAGMATELVAIEGVILGKPAQAPAQQVPAAVTQAFPNAQVVQVTPTQPAYAPQQPTYAPAPQQSAPAQPEAPVCIHGPMVFIDGTAKGKPWKGHFCPQPKEATDKCAPIFNKR